MSDKDTVYRQAAIDVLDVLCQEHRYKIPGKMETYSQYNEAWQDALDRAEGAIFNLPSAQPERKKGKWIKGAEISNRYLEDVYYCSNCHKQAYWDTDYDQQLFDYCPYCGSFNGGQASE